MRNCLLALADADAGMTAMFNFRFDGDDDVGGHNLGNLILVALSQMKGDFLEAVERASEMLAVRGRVLPSTPDDVTLVAEFVDGTSVDGESRIAGIRRDIRRIRLEPDTARAHPQVVQAIEAADLVVIGPGSLYTSLIPNLLVRGLAEALARTRARVVLVMNLMTEPGDTDGYSAVDFLEAIRRHAPGIAVTDVLVNTAPIRRELIDAYAAEGAVTIAADIETLRAFGCRPMGRDLLGAGAVIRHDPHKLARALLEVAEQAGGYPPLPREGVVRS
jgi:uncharacterized cofD-like protein